MKELGEAINESLADSDQIADVVSRIKEGGYDIFLVLEATIGVSKPGDKTSDKTSGHHSHQQSRIQDQRSGPEIPQVAAHQDRGRRRINPFLPTSVILSEICLALARDKCSRRTGFPQPLPNSGRTPKKTLDIRSPPLPGPYNLFCRQRLEGVASGHWTPSVKRSSGLI